MSNIVDDSMNEVIRKAARPRTYNQYDIATTNQDNAYASWGGLNVSQQRQLIDIVAYIGDNNRNIQTETSGTGAVADFFDETPGIEFRVQSGTNSAGYARLESKKVISYHAGIGLTTRFAARFGTPSVGSEQRAGLMNIGNELSFGYNDGEFGILHRTGGRSEIRKLTINTAATGAETVTITLNGVAFTAAVTNTNAATNAWQIATGATYTGWEVYNVSNTVVWKSKTAGSKTGTYSATSTGALAGTFSRTFAGTASTDTWIYQNDWNRSKLLSATDEFIIDPSKANVYQIQMQYVGPTLFWVKSPETAKFVLVHQLPFNNVEAVPVIDNPQLRCGIVAENTGGTTSVEVFSPVMSAFVENFELSQQKVHAKLYNATAVGTTLTNIIALKKISVAKSRPRTSDVVILHVGAAADGNKSAIFEVRLNPTFSAAQLWETVEDEVNVLTTSTGGTVSGGELLFSMPLGKVSSFSINMEHLDLIMSNSDTISICAYTISSTSDISASIAWSEI